MEPVLGSPLLARISARTIDEAECVASVLLAIVIAHLFGATHISWAAFSGYMVIRGHIAETVLRGSLRMIGTVTGGLLALTVMPFLTGSWLLEALALLIMGTGSLYAALTAKRAYAWLFFGLTFAMVVFDQMEHPQIALGAFVQTRILETIAGTLACVAVSLLSTLTLRRRWPAVRTPPATRIRWHPRAFSYAAQGGIALVLLTALSQWVEIPALAQAAISIMAVMLVPITGDTPSGPVPVRERLLHRFLGCVAGGAFAAAFLVGAQGAAPVLILGTVIGVVLGRHLENGNHPRRYAGVQFSLAVLVTLVPDSYAAAVITPGLERLSGIVIGMLMLEPVLILWQIIRPTSLEPGPAERTEEAGI
jgi:uncharacterized membrane protein YccC